MGKRETVTLSIGTGFNRWLTRKTVPALPHPRAGTLSRLNELLSCRRYSCGPADEILHAQSQGMWYLVRRSQ